MGISKKLWIPSNVVILCALVLSVLVTISLPTLTALDFVRVSAPVDAADLSKTVSGRFGIWTGCAWDVNDHKVCLPRMVGYTYIFGTLNEDAGDKDPKEIDAGDIRKAVAVTPGWTRGLAIHPVVTVVIGISLAFSLSAGHTINLLAPLVCALASAITLIAFFIDLALFLRVRALVKSLQEADHLPWKVAAGPGFWITLVIFVLNAAAGVILFIARRREMRGESAYPALSESFKSKGFFGK